MTGNRLGGTGGRDRTGGRITRWPRPGRAIPIGRAAHRRHIVSNKTTVSQPLTLYLAAAQAPSHINRTWRIGYAFPRLRSPDDTQTGPNARRPPIATHPGEANHIQEGTRGMLHSGLRAARPEMRTASLLPDKQSTTATLPSILTPGNALPCPDRAVITNGERHGLICERPHL